MQEKVMVRHEEFGILYSEYLNKELIGKDLHFLEF